jgi:hypothetical protein
MTLELACWARGRGEAWCHVRASLTMFRQSRGVFTGGVSRARAPPAERGVAVKAGVLFRAGRVMPGWKLDEASHLVPPESLPQPPYLSVSVCRGTQQFEDPVEADLFPCQGCRGASHLDFRADAPAVGPTVPVAHFGAARRATRALPRGEWLEFQPEVAVQRWPGRHRSWCGRSIWAVRDAACGGAGS